MFRPLSVLLAVLLLLLCFESAVAQQAPESAPRKVNSASAASFSWQSEARLVHTFSKSRGKLVVSHRGIAFLPAHGSALRWGLSDIQSFFLTPKRLTLLTYQSRTWHRPGEQKFRFVLQDSVPPAIAAAFAGAVGKPSRNADPDPDAPAFATLPARHKTRTGGTDGVLRFRQNGIDYITGSPGGSRSWRWADIETLANPNQYDFRVSGWIEVFNFELKQSMTSQLFDRLWNKVYARGLQVAPAHRTEANANE